MAILNDVKVALRIAATTTDFDGEINDLISAAIDDLKLAGVAADKAIDTDPLIKRAITTYCKAYFGYDNPDADRLVRAYDMLKTHLALSVDYMAYAVTFTVATAAGVKIAGATIEIEGMTVTLETNSQGVATLYTTARQSDVDYTVSKAGYADVTGSVYVDANKAVEVTMSAS